MFFYGLERKKRKTCIGENHILPETLFILPNFIKNIDNSTDIFCSLYANCGNIVKENHLNHLICISPGVLALQNKLIF